jgi:tellurite resistance protein TehA-like permease
MYLFVRASAAGLNVSGLTLRSSPYASASATTCSTVVFSSALPASALGPPHVL